MKTTYVNAAVAAASIIAAGAFAVLAPVTSVSGWFVLAALAATPALLVTHYRKEPAPTTSESIREVLR